MTFTLPHPPPGCIMSIFRRLSRLVAGSIPEKTTSWLLTSYSNPSLLCACMQVCLFANHMPHTRQLFAKYCFESSLIPTNVLPSTWFFNKDRFNLITRFHEHQHTHTYTHTHTHTCTCTCTCTHTNTHTYGTWYTVYFYFRAIKLQSGTKKPQFVLRKRHCMQCSCNFCGLF